MMKASVAMIAEKSMYDVVIVGGGLGGLETGALLAQAGARVLVLERRNMTGGRAMTVTQKGFVLNYGMHYMMGGYESAHYRILERIGKTGQVQFAPMDKTKIYRLRDGKFHHVPATATGMFTSGLLSLKGKLALARAMKALFEANPEELWRVPLGAWLAEHIHEPSLRRFFLDMAGPLTFSANPAELSTAHLIIEARKILNAKGPLALYPADGWGAVLDACRQKIEESGGEVRTRARVEGLVIDENRLAGVWCDGSYIAARAVVLALPPGEIIPLVRDHHLPELEESRLSSIRPVMGVAVDLGFMGVSNRWLATIEMPADNATSGFHNLFQPQLAPEGGLLFQGLRWMTPEQMQDEREVKRTEEIFLERLLPVFPGIRQKVVLRRTLVREVVLGADHRYDQPRTTLLPVKAASAEGLYIVGDATDAPGELSATVGESALMCAQYVQAQLAAQPAWAL